MLNSRRKAFRTTVGNHFLVAFHGMHAIRIVELYSYDLTVQSAAGIGADGLEDAGRFHGGVMRHCCDVHIVPLNQRGKVIADK